MKHFITLVCLLISLGFLKAQPTISTFMPQRGPVGTVVTIFGSNFNATPESNIVYFGAVRADVTAGSANELTVTVPFGATFEPISVLNNGLIGYSTSPFIVSFESGILGLNTFAPKIEVFTTSNPRAIAMADLDNDGMIDLAVSTSSGPVLAYRNISVSDDTIIFDTEKSFSSGSGEQRIAVGDLDGDGKIDLAVTNPNNNTLSVYRNISSGEGNIDFAARIIYTTASAPMGLAIGDIDTDGKADIVVANYSSDSVSIFRNISTGAGSINFATRVNLLTPSKPFSVSIGDLEGDGKIDLSVACSGASVVSLYRNESTSGTISFATRIDSATGSSPLYSSIGDLDGDGKPDLNVSHWGSRFLSSYLNNGAGIGTISLAPKVDFTAGAQQYENKFSDLDSDGKLDLVGVNFAGSSLSLYRNASTVGNIEFATASFSSTYNNISLAIGDLNMDGRPDFATANVNRKSISIYRHNRTELDVSAFSMPEQSTPGIIDAVNQTVAIEVPYSTDLSTLVSSFTFSEGATALVRTEKQESGITVNNFTTPVTYTVRAEDTTLFQNWTVSVSKAPPSVETDFTDFSFTDQTTAATITETNHNIEIEVAYGTDLTALIASFSLSSGASASVAGALQESGVSANDYTNLITYSVTAEDGTTNQNWTVTVTIAQNTETDFTDFSFTDQTTAASITEANHSIEIEVAYGTDLTALIASFSLSSGASASVAGALQESGVSANDYTNLITYSVTAEDGTTNQNWTVTVTIAQNTETDFTDFSFTDQTTAASITEANHSIEIEVAYGTDLTALIASFSLSSGASASVAGALQESGVSANDYTNLITYSVTAEDGTTNQNWTVSASVASPSALTNQSAGSMLLYPNPFVDKLTIKFEKEMNTYTIQVTTINGKVLFAKKLKQAETTLDLSNLSKGIYIVHILDATSIVENKIIVKE